ncbi:uncharacterized protein LOC129919724 [Episyrphus balteatus]|uniref:uncharacterized protein LOC129919724 n=1 Tax=Episyrphus balteatus TaxID=286459 RepID=UPI002485E19A|nr:uncharacterized protein LOC129919724 [Episyrphus balteatus]
MPSNSTNKKRSTSIDSTQKCQPKGRKRKRSISTDEEDVELDESATAIEKKLRSVAKMNNLSQVEMKKLIKKLVVNDHVLAFITLKAEDELAREKEEAEKSQTAAVIVKDIDPSIPKLTRAKARELNKPPMIALPSLMEPQTSEIATLIQEDLHSDEEDEEYTFKEEDFASDEDQNLTSSDMESQPRTPMTPHQSQELMESPQKFSADGVFKVPREIEGETVGDEIIATRTRSKFCLQKTTIEDLQSEFIPPDDHLDVTDTEVCGNDQEWMEFLNTFSKPLNNSFVGDDDDPVNDPEYVAAEKVPFDAEELRDVNISKKELTELVAELFEGLLNEGVCMESIELETPKKFIENNKSASSKEESPNISMNETNHHLSLVNTTQPQSAHNATIPASSNFTQLQEFSFQPGVMSTPQGPPIRPRTINNELFIKTRDDEIEIACPEFTYPTVPPPIPVQNSFEISYTDPTGTAENRVVFIPKTEALVSEVINPWHRNRYVPTQRLIKDEYVQKFEKLKHMKAPEEHLTNEPTGFTNQQYHIMQQQLQIHVQFCVQNFFQTYSHPDLWKCAAQQKQMLKELEAKGEENATFNVWNLKPALELVEEWEKELNEDTEENSQLMKFIYRELRRTPVRSRTNYQVSRFSPRIMKKLLSSRAIMYPSYLPKIPFASQRISFQCFAPAESILIAMGLERYLNDALVSKRTYRRETAMSIVCQRICNTLIYGKKFRRLRDHISYLRKSDTYNPVKYYFEHQKAPPVEHNLIWIDFSNVLPPNQRIAELPLVWQDFLHVLNAGGIINNTYPENNISYVKEITGEQIDFPSTKFSNRSVKWSQKQPKVEKENETPSVTININYMFGQAPEIFPVFNESHQIANNLLPLPENPPETNISLCQSPLKNTTNTSTTTTPERQKKLTDYFAIKAKENINKSLEDSRDKSSRTKTTTKRNKSRFSLKTKYSSCYFSKKLQLTAKKFRSAKNLQKRYENLLSVYRLNLENEFLSYKHRGLRSIFRNCKALELYTNLLRDLKMNCKKAKPSDEMGGVGNGKRKATEEQEVPKSRKANRQEENLRHMLLPDSAEDANRKDAIYAFNFYEKVEEVLKQSKRPEDCKKFNYILRSFNPKKDKVSELYYKLEKLFVPDHPELAHVFLTFLLPHEAAAIGKFFEHFMYTNAGTFFSKLNVYFNKQPAQIRKIYACISELSNDPDVNVEKMKSKIFPLLKGNTFLIDWFTQLFSSEPPPDSLYSSAENTNMKEVVSNQAGDYIETLHPNDLLDSPTESQTCQLRYINGRIFYGTKIPLPAKLSFIAKSYQADELNESLEDEKHTPTESGCVHGIREYGEKRLSASINDCSSDDNEKSEEEDFKAILNDINENEQFEICDDVTLRAHAIRLNPSYYSNDSFNTSINNLPSSCHRPLKLTSSSIEDGKGSPRKIYKASPSSTITSGVAAFKERRKSPKKNLVKSPIAACKRPATDTPSTKSNAIATAKKLKNLIEEESISDPDGAKKKLLPKRKEDDSKANEDSQIQATKDDIRLSPKKEFIKLEVVTQPWTRDEDKVILEEIKSGFKDQLLYERINSKIINRSLLEIEERHKFLMDFLSKLQSSK